jgi:hypothetical protein
MNQTHLTDRTKTILVELSAAAGQTELTSDVIDMAGFRSARAIAMLGDVTTTSVLTLNFKSNSANSTSSPTPVTETSATFTAGASDADGKTLICDVSKPTGRYVFATLTRTTADAVVCGILMELYEPYVLPVTADSNVISTSKVVKGGVA